MRFDRREIGGKAPRRRRSSARRNYSSGAIVCCMDGPPRRSPDLFQQWRAIISLIAYETAEPVSCDYPRLRLRKERRCVWHQKLTMTTLNSPINNNEGET